MSDEGSGNWDRDLYDEVLGGKTLADLVTYFDGNPGPVWDAAASCSPRFLGKLLRAIALLAARPGEDPVFAEEVQGALTGGLSYRYEGCLPEEFVHAVLSALVEESGEEGN